MLRDLVSLFLLPLPLLFLKINLTWCPFSSGLVSMMVVELASIMFLFTMIVSLSIGYRKWPYPRSTSRTKAKRYEMISCNDQEEGKEKTGWSSVRVVESLQEDDCSIPAKSINFEEGDDLI